MELNPEETSENLDKNRSYIPGVKPGEKTAAYLKSVITKLTVVGSLFLIVLAAFTITTLIDLNVITGEFAEFINTNSEKYLPFIPYKSVEQGYIQPYADCPLDQEHVGENVYLNIIKEKRVYRQIVRWFDKTFHYAFCIIVAQ